MISTDKGITWNSFENSYTYDTGIYSLAFQDSIIYIGSFGSLHVSEDLGKTWGIRNSGLPNFPVISALLVLEDKVFAGTWDHGILMSTDKGYTWTPKNKDIPLIGVNCFASIGKNIFANVGFDNKIYLSTDYGDNWALINKGLDTFEFFDQFVVIDTIIFATSYEYQDKIPGYKKIFLSADMGDTWINTDNSVVRVSGSYSIVAIGGRLFIGTNDSLYYSDDLGDTWVTKSLTNETYRGAEYLSASEDMIYAASGTELFKSSDKGDNWIPVRNNLNYGTVFSIISYQDRLYACTDGWKNFTTYGDGLYYSSDNGDTWVRQGLEGLAVYSVLFKDDFIFAGTNGGLYRSDDGGLSWMNKGSEVLKGKHVYQLNLIGENIIIPHSGGYYKSTDWGESWTIIDNILPKDQFNNVVLVDDDFIIAGLSKSIYLSFDKGETWEERSNGIPQTDIKVEAIEYIDGTIFLGTTYGIYVSMDKGLNWQSRNHGLPPAKNDLILVTSLVKSGKTLFAGVRFNSVFYTTDYGLNWVDTKCDILKNPYLNTLEIHGEYLFVGTNIYYFGSNGDAIYRAKLSDFGITDVQESVIASHFSIHPNPTSEYITISKPSEGFKPSEGSDIKIFNMLGECVGEIPLSPPLPKGETRIDISHLPRGVYYLRIGNRTQMFVKF
jgi:photosystem II stability/assembly factor-like uncharacterized protein